MPFTTNKLPAASSGTIGSPRTSPENATVQEPQRHRLYTGLIRLSAAAILLQGLWAGIFLEHDGQRDDSGFWIDVHARGGEVALVAAAIATVVAFVKLRRRADLWIGAGVLTALLMAESFIGGLIVDASKDTLTAIHVPLAMALMGLAVWLPCRAARTPKAPAHR